MSKKLGKDDIELKSFLSPLHEDVGRSLIILDSKLNRAEKELRIVNQQLIDSNTEIILQYKPIFDEQKKILTLLRENVQLAYSLNDPVQKAKIFRDMEKEDLESEIIEYILSTSTPFESWNKVAKEANNYTKKLSMTYELSVFKDEKMEVDGVSSGIFDTSTLLKWVQKRLMRVINYLALTIKYRPLSAIGVFILLIIVVAIIFSTRLGTEPGSVNSSPSPSLSPTPSYSPSFSPLPFEVVNGQYQLINGYKAINFTRNGKLKFHETTQINVLLVGGGGSGGNVHDLVWEGGGGGGGGAVGFGVLLAPAGVWIEVFVGTGGTASSNSRGGDTKIVMDKITETALGGGAGGIHSTGGSGGSGGGGTGYTRSHSGGTALKGKGNYLKYYGSPGALGSDSGAGGGGGAGVEGSAAGYGSGGNGGNGIPWFVTGSVMYGGGGGGGNTMTQGAGTGGRGGAGGGGDGGANLQGGMTGSPFTGGGGGGASGELSGTDIIDGGNGGSGIAIIAWD
jgi:hypothetical protein